MSSSGDRPELIDGEGRVVRLGRKLGHGGEGSVYEVEGSTDIVAKIYHRAPTPALADKIHVMAALRTAAIDKLTAWPIGLLSSRSGVPMGLTMPRIAGYKDIHQLYSPKSRRAEFAKADWRFLVRAATNLARAFATVHETSCLVADVNQGGVLVAQDARICLIDCDSFQVPDGSRLYLCEVGVPTFTPPELQGRPFAEMARTVNHDNFGLAVLIFLLLFMGRHPFAGRYLGIGEMTIEQAIGDGRFPYGKDALGAQMEQPPGTPSLDIASAPVARLFERAFARDSADAGRPSAREWVVALDVLERELQPCAASAVHWCHEALSACPWCQMEAATGVPLFSPALSPGAAAYFDLGSFWPQVTSLPHPGPAPALEDSVPNRRKIRPSSDAISFRRRHWFHLPLSLFVAGVPMAIGAFTPLPELARGLFFIAAFILYVLMRRMLRASISISHFLELDRQQRARWDAVKSEWEAKAGVRRFDEKRAELERLWVAWTNLDAQQAAKLRDLAALKRDLQLARYLDRVEIGPADIPGVGTGRKSQLQSFGIETAADVDERKMRAIPGFDVRLRESVLVWRRSLETNFHFDPADSVDAEDRQAVEQENLADRLRIGLEIRKGFADLQQIGTQIQFARSNLRARGESAYRALLQAEVDLRAVTP